MKGLLLFALSASIAGAAPTVGMVDTLEAVVLPGSELSVKPVGSDSPIVLRIAATYPHGDAFRYDLVYYGLEPGSYNLADYLERSDASPTGELSKIPVTVIPVLPEGQVLPKPLRDKAKTPDIGGYRAAIYGLGALWLAGFVGFFLTRNRTTPSSEDTAASELSTADHLRPLLVQAREGKLSTDGKAQLERLVLTFWRERLDLQGLPAAEAIQKLRKHEDAGKLLRTLEDWLHRPTRPTDSGATDVADLLAPYTKAPATEETDS